jgi:hypothetical protein
VPGYWDDFVPGVASHIEALLSGKLHSMPFIPSYRPGDVTKSGNVAVSDLSTIYICLAIRNIGGTCVGIE